MTVMIATEGDENWVLSANGSYIFVAGNDGFLRVYSSATGELLHSVQLGINLGAIALSPDGTMLAVTEDVAANVQQFQSWTDNRADVSLYIVDLNTFGAQALTYTVTGSDFTFADVAWSDNDTLQVSQNILPGWSGWAALSTIEVATGTRTQHGSYYTGLGSAPSLQHVPGSSSVLLGQLGLSSAEYFRSATMAAATRTTSMDMPAASRPRRARRRTTASSSSPAAAPTSTTGHSTTSSICRNTIPTSVMRAGSRSAPMAAGSSSSTRRISPLS